VDGERRKWFPDALRGAADQTATLAVSMQGLSEADAVALGSKAGIEVIVTTRDTATFPYRTKLDPRRVRLNIQDGQVVSTEVG